MNVGNKPARKTTVRHSAIWSLGLLLSCSTLQAAITADEAAQELPEQVTVTGAKQLQALQFQIREAEDLMFGLFNELNGDDIYDIHCQWQTPKNTRIAQRRCEPAFVSRVREDYAKNWLSLLRNEAGGNMLPDQAQVTLHYPILKQKMEALVEQSPQLLEAMERYNDLQAELQRRSTDSGGANE